MGTGQYRSLDTMQRAMLASGTDLVTVAIRRVDWQQVHGESTLGVLRESGFRLLPNTAGCFTARDAVLTA